jgi:divalent metal cation (Fe/Co/Zn/Cd) transporter
VVSSIGVTFGVLLATNGLPRSGACGLVALNILWLEGDEDSLSGLMDTGRCRPQDIREVIAIRLGRHDFRTATPENHRLSSRGAGPTTVTEAHEICDRIELALKTEVPDSSSRSMSSGEQGQAYRVVVL